MNKLFRAQGCLMGQLAGDALGSLVEFKTPEQILKQYPDGVRDLEDGGTWNTIAGQPTDDSEMALALARTLTERDTYDESAALEAYGEWLDSEPFDCGVTIRSGIRGSKDFASQANGALMRVAPIGIFGSKFHPSIAGNWAINDAMLTHPNVVCLQANALFAMAIAVAISTGCDKEALHGAIEKWAVGLRTDKSVVDAVKKSKTEKPGDYVTKQGWVLIAFQNALWQLLHARTLEDGVINTVMQGGDTDTNAAICGALLGSVYGVTEVPARWNEKVLNCRPAPGDPRIARPRPECYWPTDALWLSQELIKPRGKSNE